MGANLFKHVSTTALHKYSQANSSVGRELKHDEEELYLYSLGYENFGNKKVYSVLSLLVIAMLKIDSELFDFNWQAYKYESENSSLLKSIFSSACGYNESSWLLLAHKEENKSLRACLFVVSKH